MKHDMKSYTVESHTSFNAVGEISGYLVRPGMFETNGAASGGGEFYRAHVRRNFL